MVNTRKIVRTSPPALYSKKTTRSTVEDKKITEDASSDLKLAKKAVVNVTKVNIPAEEKPEVRRSTRIRTVTKSQDYLPHELLIPKRPINRIVHDIGNSVKQNVLFKKDAISCIHEMAEVHLTGAFQEKVLLATHSKRKTISASKIAIKSTLRN